MVDQAEKLRKLVSSKATDAVPQAAVDMNVHPVVDKKTEKARVIAITSGKGGVGKSSVATNLAIELAIQGKRVTIFDADLSLANIDVLLGLKPRFNLNHFIRGERSLKDIIVQGPHDIQVIPASSGIQSLAELPREQLNRLTGEFSRLEKECDFFIIDTAAGISDNVMAFVHSAEEIIVVTTPEPTAYTDAYAMIKVIDEQAAPGRIGLVINMAQNVKEAKNAASGIILISKQFLQVGVTDYGYILRDPDVPRATRRQEAFTLYSPSCSASRSIRTLANRVIAGERQKRGSRLQGFLERFTEFFQRV